MKLTRLGVGGGIVALALSVPVAAHASVVHKTCPTASIFSSVNGTLTTPAFLHKGEVLKRVGFVGISSIYTVTSVHAGSPLDRVTVSPKLPKNNIFDFRACL